MLDSATEISVEHLQAAMAWSDYAVASAELVFSAPVIGRAGQLLQAIREAGADGLAGTAQRDVFHRNVNGDEMDTLRQELERRRLIHTFKMPTAGRPAHISIAVSPLRPNDLTTKGSEES